ncbi:MAG: hypothetical protein WD851_11105, partial [Pirellulales bacterium]
RLENAQKQSRENVAFEFGEFKLQMQQAKRPGFEGVFDVCSRFPENSRAELLAASKISPRLSLKVVAFEV